MKVSKRDLILESIISAYLRDNTPIGSNELGSRMQVFIPASTIRVYFKKLSDEGAITQLHVSGGRIPTISTMNNYWKNRLNLGEKLVINDSEILENIARKFEIYCMIFSSDSQTLQEVINYRNRFIILTFDEDEIVLKFDERIFKILTNLIGIELKELEKISMQIGLSDLRVKIRELKHSKVQFLANEVVAYEIFKDERFKILLDPSITANFAKDLIFSPFFEEGYMGLKREVEFEGKNATMLCAGSVYEDFGKFFNDIMEAA